MAIKPGFYGRKEAKITTKKHICEKCGTAMKYDRHSRRWLCPYCLYAAYLTDQAQRASVRRYRESEKGKAAEKKYEHSEKGKIARERYLKSEKYKQRRREYNQRLKESLAIARSAQLPRARKLTEKEIKDKFNALARDVKDAINLRIKPSVEDVKAWAEDYGLKITNAEAQNLIDDVKRGD